MADDAFRPQKRSISQNEINDDGASNAADQLSEMAEMRKRVSENVEEELQNPGLNPEAGVQVRGNVPEIFKQAVAAKRQGPAQQKERTAAPDMRVTGSGKLEELIAGIGTKGNMVYEPIELQMESYIFVL